MSVNAEGAVEMSASASVNRIVPKLRFPEFGDEWQKKELGEIGEIVTGHTPSTKDRQFYDGEKLFVSPVDINGDRYVTDTVTKLSGEGSARTRHVRKGSSLFVCIGSTIGKVAQAGRDLATNQQINAVVPHQACDDDFVFSLLGKMSPKIAALAATQAVPIISKGTFSKVEAFLPTLNEQRKIAGFLTAVDEKIAAIKKKKELLVQYKKGAMQVIFSQSIRFRDASGNPYPDWEEQRLGDLADRITSKNKENNLNVLTISAQQGLVNQRDFFNKSVAAKDLTGYYLLSRGDFAYNKSYSKGYPMGAIKRLSAYDKGVVSTLYICFRLKEGNRGEFFDHYFGSGLPNREIEKVAQEGARNHGLLNIGVEDFFNMYLYMPSSAEEQERIADFLTALDQRIKVEDKKLEQAQQFKKALLQQMFV